jgi:methylase of polypeptide subunit release factors
LQHNLFLLTFDNKLGLSPPNLPEFKTGRVLDVGTGTGIWAIDYADEHPESEVRGDTPNISEQRLNKADILRR